MTWSKLFHWKKRLSFDFTSVFPCFKVTTTTWLVDCLQGGKINGILWNLLKNVIMFNPILPGGGALWPSLPWIRLPLSHGQGYVNQTSWFCSFPYLTGPRKPFLVFVFQKIEKNWRRKFLGSSSIRRKSEKKRFFFTNKPYFFKLNINFTCSQLSLEVHDTIETQNLRNFVFFY